MQIVLMKKKKWYQILRNDNQVLKEHLFYIAVGCVGIISNNHLPTSGIFLR